MYYLPGCGNSYFSASQYYYSKFNFDTIFSGRVREYTTHLRLSCPEGVLSLGLILYLDCVSLNQKPYRVVPNKLIKSLIIFLQNLHNTCLTKRLMLGSSNLGQIFQMHPDISD